MLCVCVIVDYEALWASLVINQSLVQVWLFYFFISLHV